MGEMREEGGAWTQAALPPRRDRRGARPRGCSRDRSASCAISSTGRRPDAAASGAPVIALDACGKKIERIRRATL